MSRSDLRWLLHAMAVGGWLAGLASDAEEGRWGAFAFAVACHIAAEAVAASDARWT